MALPILSNWLSKKIRYSFMPTIVFRFMIGSNVEQLKFDLSTVVFGSTLPFYLTELVEKNGTRSAWIQKPIFTCGKPNAYITNINGLFLPNAHSLFRSFGSEWLEERGDIRRYVFLLLQDHELYIYIFSCFIHLESSSTSTLLDFTCEENNLFISTVLNG